MKDSEIRARAKELSINIFNTCDNIEIKKGRKIG